MTLSSTETHRLADVARMVEGQIDGDPQLEVTGIDGLRRAAPGQMSFVAEPQYIHQTTQSRASALVVPEDFERPAGCDQALIRVPDVAAALSALAELFAPPPSPRSEGVHPAAAVDPAAQLGPGVSVGPGAVIEAEAAVGEGATIGPGAFVGYRASVGAHTTLGPGVKICHQCTVGDRCLLHPGVVVGGDGFGFYFRSGVHHKIPQIGTVEIGDDVEIGSNTTIDRARFGATRIGSGTKIDNLVMIAHNVQIGEHCIITGQCGIAGSAILGNYVMMGAQSGVRGHVKIGDGSKIGGQSGVDNDLPPGSAVMGMPARPQRRAARCIMAVQKLPELRKRVQDLKRKVDTLAGDQNVKEADR